MFAHLTAKAVFASCAIALACFGIGFLGLALCSALIALVGAAGAYALVGVVFLVPPLVWGIIIVNRRRPAKPEPSSGAGQVARALLAAVTKETPWGAIIGAGLMGAAEMVLNRRKSRK
jgi:hypothetical protein